MSVPKHIGIIMDGNRRFAKRLMLKPWKGHEWGAKKIFDLYEWCKGIGVQELTLYSFSIENFNRPKEEFDFLMNVFLKESKELLHNPMLIKEGIMINFIGRLYLFPQALQQVMKDLMALTKENTQFQFNFAIGYGGRSEVVDATKKIAEQIKDGTLDIAAINEQTFSNNLYFNHEPELVIRTGGEMRTSNFLSYQAAYSEWIFIDKLWPEFEKEDFLKCIKEYEARERRFGK